MGIWKDLVAAVLLREEGKEEGRRSQVLQTFYPHNPWERFPGSVGVTVTVSPCLIRCDSHGGGAEAPSPESPGGSQFHAAVQFVHRSN